MTEIYFHSMPDGTNPQKRIAFRQTAGAGPTLVFLPGYMSDMAGGKAQAVFEWAVAQGKSCLLLDYSGCGQSEGQFADGTLGRWRDEVLTIVETQTSGPVVLIGSSMGGWLMLLIALALPTEHCAGLIGIAPAPDFTTWGFNQADKAKLAAGEIIYEANPYGPEPTPTYPGFWADGQENLLLDQPIALNCPVRLLHGQADDVVPFDISLRLARALRSDDVQITLIKDGDHRLSREQDIALLLRAVSDLTEAKYQELP